MTLVIGVLIGMGVQRYVQPKTVALPSELTRVLSVAVIFALAVGPGCQDQSSLSPSPKSPEAEAVAAAAKYIQTNKLPREDLPIAWTGDPSKPFNAGHREPNEHASTAREAAQAIGMPTGRKASFLDCSGETPEMNCDIREDRGVDSILILSTVEVDEDSAEVTFVRLLEAENDGDLIGISGLYYQEYRMSLEKDGEGWKVTECGKVL